MVRNVLASAAREMEREAPGFAGTTLAILGLAVEGLPESDLLAFLSARPWAGPKLSEEATLEHWLALRERLDPWIDLSGGVARLKEPSVAAVARELFARDQDAADDLRLDLADFLEALPLKPRTSFELLHQLREAEALVRYRQALLDPPRFSILFEAAQQQVFECWNWLGDDGNVATDYLHSFAEWMRTLPPTSAVSRGASQLAFFLAQIEKKAEAEQLLHLALKHLEEVAGPEHPDLAAVLNNIGVVYLSTGRLKEAEPVCRRVVQVLVGASVKAKQSSPNLGAALNNYAAVLGATGLQPPAVMQQIGTLLAPFGVKIAMEQMPATGDSKPGQERPIGDRR